jgi:hypothetical protein
LRASDRLVGLIVKFDLEMSIGLDKRLFVHAWRSRPKLRLVLRWQHGEIRQRFLLSFGPLVERGSGFRFVPHAPDDDAFLRHILSLIHSPLLTVDPLPRVGGSILLKNLIFFIFGPLRKLLFDRWFFVFEF